MTSPAVPEGKYTDIGGGLRIHYHEAGEGFPVVFVHGSGPGASGWSNFKGSFPYFAESGFRAIVPDTLGFGYSSKPEDVDYDFDFVLGGLKRLLAALGITRCALVGNSHGGAMSIQLALDDPDLVSKLVLMAPGGLEERERYMEMKGIRSMMKAVLAPEGITRESMRKVFGHQLFDATQITDAIVEERFQIAEKQPKRVLSSLRVPYLAPRLGDMACPVLAFWGNEDQFCPVSGATTLSERCKKSRVMRISQCGHWVMVEHAKMFNEISVGFLKEC
jgi:4,5:9,10-diseco-3-hydroxy-5,9,17-trioxoandrosta-1(10),2-diene-4-oate hydrolase